MEKVNFFTEDVSFTIKNEAIYTKWFEDVISSRNKILGNINFIFCSDDHLLEINKEYLNHDYYTDIITFDYTDRGIVSGDLFISLDRVKDNGKELNQPFINELNRVMVHGVLHLLGYKDSSDELKQEMRALEDECLKKLKLDDAS